MNIITEFTDFILASNQDGSNKAGSYLLALGSVDKIIRAGLMPGFEDVSIYDIENLKDLEKIRRYLLDVGQTPGNKLLKAVPNAPSHLLNRFCSAAINQLLAFRKNEAVDELALRKYRQADTPRKAAEAISEAKISSRTFRKCVLDNYDNACCLTGLDVRETLKAAIIDPSARGHELSPDNALCLSATYAEAFKAHLITFDEKSRLVLSKALKDHTTTAIFDATFKAYENTQMRPARHFQPNERYMVEHRNLLVS